MKDYSFALNKKIVDVFTESELFDTSYSWVPWIIEIDRPLFFHLDDGTVFRLFGDNLSAPYEESMEIQKDNPKKYSNNATPVFQPLIGKTIVAVNEIYDLVCEPEELDEPRERIALDIVLDVPMLIECVYGCMFEYTQIRILDMIAA